MNRQQPYSYERVYSGGEMDPYAQAGPARRLGRMRPGEIRNLLVERCPDPKLAYTNRLVVSDQDFGPDVRLVRVSGRFVFNVLPSAACAPGEIGPAGVQRQWAQLSIRKDVAVEALGSEAAGADGPAGVFLSTLEVELSFMNTSRETAVVMDAEEVAQLVRASLEDMVISVGQLIVLDVHGHTLKGVVSAMSGVPVDVLQGTGAAGDEATSCGVVSAATDVAVSKALGSLIELKGAAVRRKANAIIQPDFRFEDLGIGGLDAEFSSIFRRAFASRIFPAELVARLGIQHVKGILLYGPPGTGKTLMARQIGKMLNAVDPLVVSGPEILNKFVGQSEENVRKLFEPAEKEYRERGDDSQLHIIIFDELDAICKQRGSRGDSTGTGDSVVNQLLAKMDGVDQLNNILLIGMTNRKELIDDALLRPGRLEVHIEVGLPDEAGRLQILKIHTAKIRENGMLAPEVDLAELAAQTRNFSGAEIAALVKSASSYAFTRHIKVGGTTELTQDVSDMTIQHQDFVCALDEVKPAFGASASDLDMYVGSGIIEYAPHVRDILYKSHLFAEQVRESSRSPLVSLLLHGPAGSGKTALAATIAQQSAFPFVRLVSPEAMVGFTDSQKIAAITKVFHDAYKSPLSLVVVDDIERLLEWVPIGARFSNAVLQTLLVLIKKHPPPGRRLLVVATTSERDVLAQMDLATVFSSDIYVENIGSIEALKKVVQHARLFDSAREYDGLFSSLADYLGNRSFSIGVKKLLLLIETARQDPDKHSRFMSEICALF
ncbi:transport between ER and Golgi ATPase protein [Coemansia javaensis]|uniref:Vesicular-fusion protein SEC18 n=1 Tax=Coemansia javaensis TaxID=2761396 RepID=A0A9W8H7P5_9FUNG|nr:transport between ER and Golgi ATPase protein [Coemansia javaensis]